MTAAASALIREIPDGRAAAAAAVRQLTSRLGARPETAFVFGTPTYRPEAEAILAAFRDAGCSSVVGGCASGVLTDEGEAEGGPALAALVVSGCRAAPFHVAAEDLPAALPAGDLAVVLPDPSKVDLVQMVRGLESRGPFRAVVGGALSGGPENGHWQFAGDRVVSGEVTGTVISGEATAIGVAHGSRPIGRPLVVTRSEGHIVLSLAGKPPLDMLQEALEAHARTEGGPGGPVLAGLAVDSAKSPLRRGDFLVRNLVAVQTDHGAVLAIGSPVRVGQTLVFHLMDRASAMEDMKEMVAEVAADLKGPPAFGLYFNCRGRGKFLYGETDHDVAAIRQGLGTFPFVGFFGNAEFAPVAGHNWLHNYTGVLAVSR